MAIEDTAMAQAMLLDDGLGSLPDQKVELDGITVFVVADSAFALMAEEIGRRALPMACCANYSIELHVPILGAVQNTPD